MFISGTVGQRFGLRNSGGIGVVEGCSAHGAEYMTGGTLIVLGKVGFNFGAGMTGGKAIVLSTQKNFKEYVSKAAPEYRKLNEIDILELRINFRVAYRKNWFKSCKKDTWKTR